MNVEIRAAAPEEADDPVPAYEWLFAAPGSRPPGWDPERAAERLRGAIISDAAVAREGEALVGLCTGYDDIESVRFGRRAWVEDLAVASDRRSLGTGKLLPDTAKDWGRARGATHLGLDSALTREAAHRFYERERPSWCSMSFGWEL